MLKCGSFHYCSVSGSKLCLAINFSPGNIPLRKNVIVFDIKINEYLMLVGCVNNVRWREFKDRVFKFVGYVSGNVYVCYFCILKTATHVEVFFNATFNFYFTCGSKNEKLWRYPYIYLYNNNTYLYHQSCLTNFENIQTYSLDLRWNSKKKTPEKYNYNEDL